MIAPGCQRALLLELVARLGARKLPRADLREAQVLRFLAQRVLPGLHLMIAELHGPHAVARSAKRM